MVDEEDKPDANADKVDEPKLDSETALAKIKVLIAHFYEMRGRKDYDDSYGEEQELLEDIEDVLSNTNIAMKKVIIEKLELDKIGKRVRISGARRSDGVGWGKILGRGKFV